MLSHLIFGGGIASFAISLVLLYRLIATRTSLLKRIRGFFWVLVFQSLGVAGLSLGLLLMQHQPLKKEIPVAFVAVESDGMARAARLTFTFPNQQDSREFEVKGDQWVVEADIINWSTWLDWLGLTPYYRLTRVRGRYNRVEDERNLPASIFALDEGQDDTFWDLLYDFGRNLPMIDTVYGSAVIQKNAGGNRFAIYVGPDGLLTRKQGS